MHRFQKMSVCIKFDPESITNKNMFERGLIEPPNSDFNAPVVQVGKKDGRNRFCIVFMKMCVVTNFDPESMTNRDLIERELIEPPIQISMHQTY